MSPGAREAFRIYGLVVCAGILAVLIIVLFLAPREIPNMLHESLRRLGASK
jgi:hypothetical protein